VDAAKRFAADKAFQGFDAEGELAQGKRALAAEAAGAFQEVRYAANVAAEEIIV
jgi:hypothetical protein